MKKSFTLFAAALLLAGCNKVTSYDDTFVMEKLANLEQRVTALESSIQSIQSTLGDGKFVQKVQELTDETGKTVGITVTYTTGEVVNFTISKVTDPDAAPVLSVMLNGAGELCWAIDGVILKDNNGQDVLVYKTPSFVVGEDGHLYAVVDGDKIDLGLVKGEKGDEGEKGDKGDKGDKGEDGTTPVIQDGIIKDLQVTDEAVIIVYGDNNQSVSIPLVSSFRLNIEKTEFVLISTDPIEVPYTITNATAETIVDVFCGNELRYKVETDKVVFTPKSTGIEAQALVYADSRTGLTSIVKLVFEGETFEVEDAPYSGDVDYLVEDAGAAVEVNVVSNIPFDVKPQVEWIKYVETKAQHYTVCLTVDDNTAAEPRTGNVNIVRKGTGEVLQTIVIGQKPHDSAINLSKKESANCYIVPAAGEYKFAAVKGNSSESVGAVTSAEVLWETWNNNEEVTANSVIASAEYADGFIKFETPAAFHAGNAVIAAKDAEGTVLWSWHIWAPATEITANPCGIWKSDIMDRNLGALNVAVAGNATVDVSSFGLTYQWGRKDPFVGAGSLEDGNATVAGKAISLAPKTGTNEDGAVATISLEFAIQNPTVMGYSAGADWIDVSDNNLWKDKEKTIYDPCPAGYRVPERDKTQLWFASAPDAVLGWAVSPDYAWFTMGDPATVFPICGYRDDCGPKSLYKVGKRTAILTSHIGSDTSAYALDIRSDGDKYKLQEIKKARGAYVRCVAE